MWGVALLTGRSRHALHRQIRLWSPRDSTRRYRAGPSHRPSQTRGSPWPHSSPLSRRLRLLLQLHPRHLPLVVNQQLPPLLQPPLLPQVQQLRRDQKQQLLQTKGPKRELCQLPMRLRALLPHLFKVRIPLTFTHAHLLFFSLPPRIEGGVNNERTLFFGGGGGKEGWPPYSPPPGYFLKKITCV